MGEQADWVPYERTLILNYDMNKPEDVERWERDTTTPKERQEKRRLRKAPRRKRRKR